ncbi:MAG: hypothetical protein JW860_14875 [Sedimentisphaerales bacterium]|nr:hypothetical protein [Sedimentisphaerales bacterium]
MPDVEKVLVVNRSVFEELGEFQGVRFDVERYLERLLDGSVLQFIDRPVAEQNPQHKQLIPYVIMAHEDTFLCYVRGKRAGEQRLMEKTSIGIGGHINPIDEMPLLGDDQDMYENAVMREVAEEVEVDTSYRETIAGLINDDSNAVGQVHLGVIHIWQLDKPQVTKREQMICQLNFMTIPELQQIRDKMETWSQLCLDNLESLIQKCGI